MSTSPPSSHLETPISGRSSRARKPVKHFGSYVISEDVISEEEGYKETEEEEDESFEAKGGKEESDDESAVEDGSDDGMNLVGRTCLHVGFRD